MKYLSYGIVIISILYINITQASLEPIETPLPINLPADVIGSTSSYLTIADMINLIGVNTDYYTIPSSYFLNKKSFMQKDLLLIPFGINRLLINHPQIVWSLSDKDYIELLAKYAKEHNKDMFDHIKKNENHDNALIRKDILSTLKYTTEEEKNNLTSNMKAFRCIAKGHNYKNDISLKIDALDDLANYVLDAGHIPLLRVLLTQIPPNSKIGSRFPLLHRAIACGHFPITEILLQKGANIHEEIDGYFGEKKNALTIAQDNSRLDIEELLMRYDAKAQAHQEIEQRNMNRKRLYPDHNNDDMTYNDTSSPSKKPRLASPTAHDDQLSTADRLFIYSSPDYTGYKNYYGTDSKN